MILYGIEIRCNERERRDATMNISTIIQLISEKNIGIFLALVLSNLLFNVLANASFKYSAVSPTLFSFIAWQVVGNLAGFITVITLTAMLKTVPLSIAFPLTSGLAVIGVQVLGAYFLFHESISLARWAGTIFIILGIVLISGN
jgi:multidrug transporter EmrE-like cation transporter